jgi:glycerol-3-phosphate dehydrogenase (NAD(P)+)
MRATRAKSTVTVLGDGGWGTTIALHLARKGYSVVLWGAFAEHLTEMRVSRENKKFLPGFHIPEAVTFEADIAKAVAASDVVFLAMPSKFFRPVLKRVDRTAAGKKLFVILTKGIERKSLRLMSGVLEETLGRARSVVVSGPCISREIAQEIPTAVVAASASAADRARVRGILSTPAFTVLESPDAVGVQLGGSVKNVLAIAAGILDGLGYGSNIKSVLLARGISEIVRLGRKMKAKPETFLGLSGLGDLATTAFSIHSRNHGCGFELGKGASLKEVLSRSEMVVEGVETADSALALAKKLKVEVPIVKAVVDVLHERRGPDAIVDAVMHKKFINESD